MNEYTRRAFSISLAAALAAPVAFALTGCGSSGATSGSSAASGSASDGSTGSSTSAASSASDAPVTTADFNLVEAGKLTIGSDLAYPPMEYLDGDTPKGFGVAMMQEICRRIGLTCNFLAPQNFDTLVTQVAGGTKMDVAMSSITITDERAEQIDFTDPYFDSNQAIVVLKDADLSDRDELDGQPVGAQSGSTGEDWIRENLKSSTYVPYNTPAEALAALRTGKIVAAIYDEPVAQNNVAGEYDDCRILDVIATGEQYGIAVNKDNKALTSAINEALEAMQADGTMDDLKATWIEGGQASSAASSAADAGAAASSAGE